MKRGFLLTLILSLFLWSPLLFAGNGGELTPAVLKELKQSFKMNAMNRAVMNAATNNDIKDLALNRERVNSNNNVFNVNTGAKGITDQQSTGRCWMFAGLNILRPEAKKKFNLDEFEFSQAYLFFWDKLEKSNLLLEAMITLKDRDLDDREVQALLASPVPDGGWWNYVVNLIEKYGVVPKEIMPETKNTSKSAMMNKTIENLVRQDAAELRNAARKGTKISQLRERKMEMLKDVYRLLALHMGVPPEEFTWRYVDKDDNIVSKTYTPVAFYKEAVAVDLNNYVTLFDYPVHPYQQHYQINYCRNMPDAADMDFVNLDIDQLKAYTFKSLKDGEPVWFAADAGWQMDRKYGIMADDVYDYQSLFGVKDDMTKAERISYRVSIPNHAMVFVAADTVDGKPVKWKVENSWGTDIGDKGYWTMYNNWFDKYVYTVIINKKYLPQDVLALLKTKPKTLPAWDPMRHMFE